MKVTFASLLFPVLIFVSSAVAISAAAPQHLRSLKKSGVSGGNSGQTIAVAVDGTILGDLLEITDLLSVFAGPGPFTVFAPADNAFKALNDINENVLACLTKDDFKFFLAVILKYHVVSGAGVLSTDLSDGQTINTLAASSPIGDVAVTINNDDIFIDSSKVIAPDNVFTNGVVHGIDAVLTGGPFDLGLLSPCLEDPDSFS